MTSKVLYDKHAKTIAGKIALQMNAKLGLPLWIVPSKHPFWNSKNVMIGGLSVTKNLSPSNNENYVMALVGSIMPDHSQVFSYARTVEEK